MSCLVIYEKIFYLDWILDLFLIVKVSEIHVICYLLVTFTTPTPSRMSEELMTKTPRKYLSSVQFSHSVESDSLRPHESQHARPPCPSPTPGVYSDASIESVMPSSHLILCRPLLLLPSIPPSISIFSNESTLHMKWS